MKYPICHRSLPYLGARCDCGDQERAALDWNALLARVRAIDVPSWADSPMEQK